LIAVEALLFDLDGTLIDSARDLANSIRSLQRRLGRPESTDAEVAAFIGDGVVKLVSRALPGVEGPDLRQAIDFFKGHYRRHCLETTRPYRGVREILGHFRHKKLAVVTNKPVRISRQILDSLGLLSCFSYVLGGDSLRFKKPEPEPVRFVLSHLRISNPRQAVLVGDGVNDVLAGRGAGCYTCGILSNISNPEALRLARPDFLIKNTIELMRIFN